MAENVKDKSLKDRQEEINKRTSKIIDHLFEIRKVNDLLKETEYLKILDSLRNFFNKICVDLDLYIDLDEEKTLEILDQDQQDEILEIIFPKSKKEERDKLIPKLKKIKLTDSDSSARELGKLFLKDKYPDNIQRKEELIPIFKEIILSKDKKEIKQHFKEFIEILKRFKVSITPKFNEPKDNAPVLWSGGRPKFELKDDEYNSKIQYYDDEMSPLFNILWSVARRIIEDIGDPDTEINDTYCQKMFELGRKIGVTHIPYDRILSELWVEEMVSKQEHISKHKIRIEFGQNNPERDKNEVFFTTYSVMAMSELPILLDLIAQYNIKMDLEGTPEKKVYLENIGISAEEIKNDNYKSINERYGKGENDEYKNNKNAGYIVVKGVKRDSDGDISEESAKNIIRLKSLILKLEKRRLRKAGKRLDEIKEEITKENILKEAISIKDSFDNEEQQHNFIERARSKGEINYLMNEFFIKNKKDNSIEVLTNDQNKLVEKEKTNSSLEILLNERKNDLRSTKIIENEIYKTSLMKEEEASNTTFIIMIKKAKRLIRGYIKSYEFLRNLADKIGF